MRVILSLTCEFDIEYKSDVWYESDTKYEFVFEYEFYARYGSRAGYKFDAQLFLKLLHTKSQKSLILNNISIL